MSDIGLIVDAAKSIFANPEAKRIVGVLVDVAMEDEEVKKEWQKLCRRWVKLAHEATDDLEQAADRIGKVKDWLKRMKGRLGGLFR